jgi:hypothetical protein
MNMSNDVDHSTALHALGWEQLELYHFQNILIPAILSTTSDVIIQKYKIPDN